MRILLTARRIATDIWKSELTPSEVDLLGQCPSQVGQVSVVVIEQQHDRKNGELVLDTESAVIVNRGTTPVTVFVASAPRLSAANDVVETDVAGGDSQFIQALTPELKSLGEHLLAEVRDRWPGQLQLMDISRRFVDTPDNFWTVKVQPRDGSLRITVRGEPRTFSPPPDLLLRADRNGYSSFKLRALAQLPAAVDILQRARRR